MTRIVLTWILLAPLSLLASDIQQIREEFYAAVNSKDKAETFYEKMKVKRAASPLLMAYYGSAQAVMSKHAWNPYRKVAYLKSGMADIEAAIKKSPDNLEIRFLRFSIEHHLPPFLGFSKHLEEDRRKILQLIEKRQFGTADSKLIKNIVTFLKKTDRFSEKEVEVLDEGIKNG